MYQGLFIEQMFGVGVIPNKCLVGVTLLNIQKNKKE